MIDTSKYTIVEPKPMKAGFTAEIPSKLIIVKEKE
jgi:hypothetical protein